MSTLSQPQNGNRAKPQLTGGTTKRLVSYEPVLTKYEDVKPEPVKWLWKKRIPLGLLTAIVGRQGCGKSFLTIGMAARVSTGTPWPDGEENLTGGTILIGEEDPSDYTIAPRLAACEAKPEKIRGLGGGKCTFDNGEEVIDIFELSNLEPLRMALDSMPDCRLVVIDPIGAYLDGHGDYKVRKVLQPLAALACEKNVAVVMIMHTRKAGAKYADDMALGSRALTALPRSVLHLINDPEDENRKLLLAGKPFGRKADGLAFRIEGDDGKARLAWEEDPLVGTYADDMINAKSDSRHGPEPVKLDAACEWLAGLLKDGPKMVKDIEVQAENAGHSKATLERARKLLKVVATKGDYTGGWMWSLAEDSEQDN